MDGKAAMLGCRAEKCETVLKQKVNSSLQTKTQQIRAAFETKDTGTEDTFGTSVWNSIGPEFFSFSM